MEVKYIKTGSVGMASYKKTFQMQWTLEDGQVTGLNGHDWHGKLEGGVGGSFVIHDRANNLIEFHKHKEWVVG